MSMSLRDQFLQAGLVNERQSKEAERQLRQQQRERQQLPKDKRAMASHAELAAKQTQLAKAARDQELSRGKGTGGQKSAPRADRATDQQNRLPRAQTDERYNFVDGDQIRASPPITRCVSGSVVARLRSFAATEAMSSCERKLQRAFASATNGR